jgi:hypothetical protein
MGGGGGIPTPGRPSIVASSCILEQLLHPSSKLLVCVHGRWGEMNSRTYALSGHCSTGTSGLYVVPN